MPLRTSEALNELNRDDYFIIVHDGQEALLKAASYILMAAKLSDALRKQEETTFRLEAFQGFLGSVRSDIEALRHDTTLPDAVEALQERTEALQSRVNLKLDASSFPTVLLNHLSPDRDTESDSLFLGLKAGDYQSVDHNVCIGQYAGYGALATHRDSVAIGTDSPILLDQSFSLGKASTLPVAGQTVAVRSDERDFFGRGLDLGLSFVLSLDPRRGKMDFREAYTHYASMPLPPEVPIAEEPTKAYRDALKAWQEAYNDWKAMNDPVRIQPTGLHEESRERFTLLAQDVKAKAEGLGSSFPGAIETESTWLLKEGELIPVLVKAVQELHALLYSPAYLDTIAYKILEKMGR